MKHKVIAALLLSAVGAASCQRNAATGDNTYAVSAAFPDGKSEGMTAYIINYDNGEKIDSALVTDNVAEFSGVVDSVVLARLLVGNMRAGTFVLEPGTIAIDSGHVSQETPMNILLASFTAESDSVDALYNTAATDSARTAVAEGYQKLLDRYIGSHYDNPVGYLAFLQAAYEYDADTLAAKLRQYPAFAGYKRVSNLVTAKEREAATSAGKHYVDFAVGKESPVRLSDFVHPGSYTLVDFWASWCGSCRREMPVIRGLYDRYHDAGLDVVGVAVWDAPDDTRKAVGQLDLPWLQILDAQSVPTDLYGISGIPHIMLIGPDGIVVARGMQGDSLRTVVSEAMAGFHRPTATDTPLTTAQQQ